MSRKKGPKLAELQTFPNVVFKDRDTAGTWNSHIFNNNHPIVLELGCGKGEYTLRMAEAFPNFNYIGIDLKGARLWRAAKDALASGLKNVAFLQINIIEICDYFATEEVSEIFIPFPDPFKKPSKSQKRLISKRYLDLYAHILKKKGLLHFKTDNGPLYNFALYTLKTEGHEILANTDNLYQSGLVDFYTSIPTYFEQLFIEKGETIKYIKFRLQELGDELPDEGIVDP
jgi:tRNA (guanine-N7-)-methyltransferase